MRLLQQTFLPDIQHRLSTNTLSKSKRIQRWGNFITGFSIEFVEKCLEELKDRENSGIVLDPFAGCGTTLIGAKKSGFNAIGYEPHPVFSSITEAKIGHYQLEDVYEIVEFLSNDFGEADWSPDARLFLEKLFPEDNLYHISRAAYALQKMPSGLKFLGITIFLKACELACGSQTDGIYKAPTSRKHHIPFTEALQSVQAMISDDIESEWYQQHWLHTPQANIICKSSEDMSKIDRESVAICITSPPYLNNFDYSEMTRMHLYLLGWCKSWKDISEKIRNHLITNTTTALNGKKTPSYQIEASSGITPNLLPELDNLVKSLRQERSVRPGKKEYDYLIYPYYFQISTILSNIYNVLQPCGKLHWVVADAALYGIYIETQKHTEQIMKALGFRDVKIHYLRKRGHRWILSKRDGHENGLDEYHIEATK